VSLDEERDLVDEALAGPLAPLADRMRPLVAPSARLVTGSGARGRSRIGGDADLPPGVDWPTFRDRALGFVAQVDAAELPPGFQLPAGLWSFFYEVGYGDQRWGFDPADRGHARVLHTPPGVATKPRPQPPVADAMPPYAPRDVVFREELTLPSPDSAPGDALLRDAADELKDAYWELFEPLDELHGGEDDPRHRLFGHPDQIQGDMQTECQLVTNGLFCGDASGYEDPRADALRPGAAEWRLLLQLDSEFEPQEVLWGDAGRIYFWMREADLAAARTDAAWAMLQCS
jgi:uncharacterized protein YwqG